MWKKKWIENGCVSFAFKYIKRVFLVFACADIQFLKNRSEKALNLAQNDNFSILSLFVGHFCNHSKGKSKKMPEFNTWTILLINQLGEIGEKQLSVFSAPEGVKFAP